MKENNAEKTIFQDFFYQAATLEQNQMNSNCEQIMTYLGQFENLYNECVNEVLPKAKINAQNELCRDNNSPLSLAAYVVGGITGIGTGYICLTIMPPINSIIAGFSVFGITTTCLVHNLNKKETNDRENYDYSIISPVEFEHCTNYYTKELLEEIGIQQCYDRIMEQFKDYKINSNEETKVYQKSL